MGVSKDADDREDAEKRPRRASAMMARLFQRKV
jgi:hypothetical protein